MTQKTHVIDLSKKVNGPETSDKSVTLESFIENVKSDILRTTKVSTDTFDNLTPVERTALYVNGIA